MERDVVTALPPAGDGRPASLGCWCGRGSWRTCFRTRRFGLVRCTACGTYRIDPPPIASDGESGTFYTHYYEGGNPSDEVSLSESGRRPGRASRFWNVVSRVPSLDGGGGRVLDVGCGEGGLCAELHAAGWRDVFGLDVSRSRVARARRNNPGVEFFDELLPNPRIAGSSMDLVVMDNVIEHMPDPVSQLAAVRDCLRPGGRLVVITPNMESGCFRLLGRRWTPELSPHAHIFLFIPSSMRTLLARAGFEVEAEGNFGGHYPGKDLIAPFLQRDWKLGVWRLVQDAGLRYGELIRSGPMLYAVARKPATAEAPPPAPRAARGGAPGLTA